MSSFAGIDRALKNRRGQDRGQKKGGGDGHITPPSSSAPRETPGTKESSSGILPRKDAWNNNIFFHLESYSYNTTISSSQYWGDRDRSIYIDTYRQIFPPTSLQIEQKRLLSRLAMIPEIDRVEPATPSTEPPGSCTAAVRQTNASMRRTPVDLDGSAAHRSQSTGRQRINACANRSLFIDQSRSALRSVKY